jgi:hypothetical protein
VLYVASFDSLRNQEDLEFVEKVSCDVILNEVKDLTSLEGKILRYAQNDNSGS